VIVVVNYLIRNYLMMTVQTRITLVIVSETQYKFHMGNFLRLLDAQELNNQ
jgi:hypothetical protein